jgi:hypothetical protein
MLFAYLPSDARVWRRRRAATTGYYDRRCQRSQSVGDQVADVAAAVRHESLVELVGKTVYDRDGDGKPEPPPVRTIPAKRPPYKRRQDRVDRNVLDLVIPVDQVKPRHVRQLRLRGQVENETHPGKHGSNAECGLRHSEPAAPASDFGLSTFDFGLAI